MRVVLSYLPRPSCPPSSQRNISVFLRGVLVALVFEIPKCRDELAPRLARLNHFVDESPPRRDVRARELFAEFRNLLRPERCRVGRGVELALIKDVDRPFGTHDGDLGRGPRVIEIRTDVLARHDAVRAPVRLPRDDRDL